MSDDEMVCEWFAGCTRPAAGWVRHPAFEAPGVPCCVPCAEKLDLVLVDA